MQILAVCKSYYVTVVSGNVIEIYYIRSVDFAKLIFRQSAIDPRHCFSAAEAFVFKTYKTVFIVCLQIKNIVCSYAENIVTVLYP